MVGEPSDILRAEQRGDAAAAQPPCSEREELVARYRPLVVGVLRRMGCLGDEDIEQTALIGLVAALNRFDPEIGCPFEAFATPTIAGEVKRYLRDQTRMLRPPRGLVELRYAARDMECRLVARNGRSPTISEIADALGVELDHVVEAMALEETCHPRSLDGLMDSPDCDHGVSRAEFLGAEDPALTSADTRLVLQEAVAALEPRLREVIELCFYEGLPQKEAAARLGVSQMQVSRLQRLALEQLRGHAVGLDGLVGANA